MTKTSNSILFALLFVLVFSPIIGTVHADIVTVSITPVFNDAGVPQSITITPNPHFLKDGDTLKWDIANTECPPDSHPGTTKIITPPGSPFGQVAPNDIVGGVIAFAPKDIEWPDGVTSYSYSVTFACSPEITHTITILKDMDTNTIIIVEDMDTDVITTDIDRVNDNNSSYLPLSILSLFIISIIIITIYIIYLQRKN